MHDETEVTKTADLAGRLVDALSDDSPGTIRNLLSDLHPAQLADALEAVPWDSRPDLWAQVDTGIKGEVLLEAHGDVRSQLVEATSRQELLAALAELEPDELADIDAQLPVEVIDAMLQRMPQDRRAAYELVRSYPDDTAGGLMDVDAAAVRDDVSLSAVLRYLRGLRQRDGSLPEHLDSLMVVDRDNILLGVLMLSDVVSLSADTLVADVMNTEKPALLATTPASQVSRVFQDQDLVSAPVVGESGQLLGRITVDDVVDVMRVTAERQVLGRAGLDEGTDMFAPILKNASRRAVWLSVNLLNAMIAASVIGLFEDSIEKVVALAVLMPIIASMGGVAGNQTLTLVIRGLALEQVSGSNIARLLRREVASGLLNGVFWAAVVAVVVIAWFDNVTLGLVFGAAMIINLVTGAVSGTLVPFFLQRLGIDPALAGGVLLTAATDVIGFFAFLGLATWLLI